MGKKKTKKSDDWTGFNYDAETRVLKIDLYEDGKGSKRTRPIYRDIGRRDAEAIYLKLREELRRGEKKLGRKPTLAEYEARYPRQKRLSAKAARTRKYNIADLLDAFDDVRIDKIDTDAVMKYIQARLANGLEEATIRRRINELRATLKEAIERGIIVKLPFNSKVVFAAVKDPQPLVRYLTAIERKRLLDAFDDEAAFRASVEARKKPGKRHEGRDGERSFGGSRRGDSEATGRAFAAFRRVKAFVLCLIDAGLRRDDARLLTWERVNCTDSTIFLYQSKTGESVFVPMTRDLAAAIVQLHAQRDPETPYVFVTEAGKPFSISTINRAWKMAKTFAGITRPFRLHDCRHTTGSGLVQAGVPLAEVGQLLGHRDLRSTRRYAHLAPENLRSAIQKLEQWQEGPTNAVGNFVGRRRLSRITKAATSRAGRGRDSAQLTETKRAAVAALGHIRLERETGLEPATSTLARLHSTN
jgi:integrase